VVADLRGIEALLASRIGLDPISVGSRLISRAAHKRMKELGLGDMAAYESRVRQSEPELQSLIEEVIVPESWFFRDDRPFQWFRDYVCAKWLSDALRPPLRILSLPCAGGEEPYSIAMTLNDLGLPDYRFFIDGIDISAHRLEIARRGIYSANAFRGSDLSFRARYFRELEGAYELDATIRSKVHFAHASVLDPNLLYGSPPYDIVFCRNLLIYLDTAARVRVLTAIERILKRDGILFIGHADRLEVLGIESKFASIDDPACFAYRRKTGGDVMTASLQIDPIGMMPIVSDHEFFVPAVINVRADTAFAPQVIPDSIHDTTQAPYQADDPPLLEQAAEMANRGQFPEAIAACERHLLVNEFSASTYHLMGMIHQAAGNRQRAEDCFHKAVYLDPTHDEALLTLALLAERRGDLTAALGFRRRADRSMNLSRKRMT
jgi:chemotaxis protein methyltransferase WspC